MFSGKKKDKKGKGDNASGGVATTVAAPAPAAAAPAPVPAPAPAAATTAAPAAAKKTTAAAAPASVGAIHVTTTPAAAVAAAAPVAPALVALARAETAAAATVPAPVPLVRASSTEKRLEAGVLAIIDSPVAPAAAPAPAPAPARIKSVVTVKGKQIFENGKLVEGLEVNTHAEALALAIEVFGADNVRDEVEPTPAATRALSTEATGGSDDDRGGAEGGAGSEDEAKRDDVGVAAAAAPAPALTTVPVVVATPALVVAPVVALAAASGSDIGSNSETVHASSTDETHVGDKVGGAGADTTSVAAPTHVVREDAGESQDSPDPRAGRGRSGSVADDRKDDVDKNVDQLPELLELDGDDEVNTSLTSIGDSTSEEQGQIVYTLGGDRLVITWAADGTRGAIFNGAQIEVTPADTLVEFIENAVHAAFPALEDDVEGEEDVVVQQFATVTGDEVFEDNGERTYVFLIDTLVITWHDNGTRVATLNGQALEIENGDHLQDFILAALERTHIPVTAEETALLQLVGGEDAEDADDEGSDDEEAAAPPAPVVAPAAPVPVHAVGVFQPAIDFALFIFGIRFLMVFVNYFRGRNAVPQVPPAADDHAQAEAVAAGGEEQTPLTDNTAQEDEAAAAPAPVVALAAHAVGAVEEVAVPAPVVAATGEAPAADEAAAVAAAAAATTEPTVQAPPVVPAGVAGPQPQANNDHHNILVEHPLVATAAAAAAMAVVGALYLGGSDHFGDH